MKGGFVLTNSPAAARLRWGWHFAALSYWAYHANPALDGQLLSATGLTNFAYHASPSPNVPAWFLANDGVGYQVGIEGTADIKQALAYVLQFGLENVTGLTGRTFTPFNQWSDTLVPLIAAATNATKRITLTGHSLGGAMAILVGEKLKAIGRNVQCAVTFGCPRIADEAFANGVRGRIANVRRLGDVIPSVPPAVYVRLSNGPFSLPSLPSLYRPGFDYVLPIDSRFTPNASALVSYLAPLGFIEAIDDTLIDGHRMGNYVIQLWDYLDRDSRAANLDLYLVMRDFFNLPLAPTILS